MVHMFPVLPKAIVGPGGRFIDPAKFRAVLPPKAREAGAAGDWRLKGDSSSLTDALGAVLTPKNTAPTYNAKSIILPDGGMNGLETPWTENNTTDVPDAVYSWVVIAKRPPVDAEVRVVAGTVESGASTGGGGQWLADGQVRFSRRSGGVTLENLYTPPSTLAVGDICMMGWSQSNDTGIGVLSVGNGIVAATMPTPSDYSPGARKIALGNVSTPAASWDSGIEVYRFIVWLGTALSALQFAEVYVRARLLLLEEELSLE